MKTDAATPGFVSSVFKATSADVINPAIITYNSVTRVSPGYEGNTPRNPAQVYASFRAGFSGAFESVIGPQNITTRDDLQRYNDAFIQAMQQKKLFPEQYLIEFNKAYEKTPPLIYIDYAKNLFRQTITLGKKWIR